MWSGPPVWIHGDLHPCNLLVTDGRLSAVLDFGNLTAGDPATDLSVAWMRARGWGLALGLAYLAHSRDNADMGTSVARRWTQSFTRSFRIVSGLPTSMSRTGRVLRLTPKSA